MTTPKLVKRAAAAKALKVPAARIGQMVNDGAPVARSGRHGIAALYDVEELRAWQAARAKPVAANLISIERERAGLLKAQRLAKERENKRLAGLLVSRDQVIREGKSLITAAKARMMNIPHLAVNTGVIQVEHVRGLKLLIHDALLELSRITDVAGCERMVAEHKSGEEITD